MSREEFPVFRTGSSIWLLVFIFIVLIGLTDGIVYRTDSSSSSESSFNSNNGAFDSRENEIRLGRSSEAESSNPYTYFRKDQSGLERFSEGGGLLLDNSFENLGRNTNDYSKDYNTQNTQLGKEEKVKWKGWNYLDTSKAVTGWTPHEKTISFQFLDDENRYNHAPPSWPHDEYMLQFGQPLAPHGFGLRNGSDATNSGSGATGGTASSNALMDNNAYEWQKLHARPSNSLRKGHFIGPGFYDYGSSTPTLAYNPYYTHQAITDSNTITSSSASSSSNDIGDGQIPNAVSESATHGKLYSGGYGGLSPYDYYRRKRLRLKIHPGLLVAPIAGFAAYKAVSAIASKPLLFELGWVGNKPNIDVGGGWGWPRPPYPYYPPVVQPLNPYPQPALHPIHIPQGYNPGYGGQLVPILRPRKKPAEASRSWWNPFSALTPRFRSNINKKDDRSGDDSVDNNPDENTAFHRETAPDVSADGGNWFERP